MKRIYSYILCLYAAVCCTPDPGPDADTPVDPQHEYANEFSLRCAFTGNLWTSAAKSVILDASTSAKAGYAELLSGAGKETALLTIHTDLPEGTPVRLVTGSESLEIPSRQICSEGDTGPQGAVYATEEFLLSIRPVEASLSMAGSILRVDCNGAIPDSVRIGSITLVPDNTFPTILYGCIRPGSDPLSVKRFPGGNETVLPSRDLKSGKTYRISLEHSPTIASDRSKSEFTYTSEKYKKKSSENLWSTAARNLSVSGMNWMPKVCVPTHDRWGGYAGVKPDEIVSANPDGYWRTGKYNGRSVMVDPDGNVAILHGVNGACPERCKEATSGKTQALYDAHFSSNAEWADYAGRLLGAYGFNFYSLNPKRIRLTRDYFDAESQARMHSATPGAQLSEVAFCYLLRTFYWDYYSLYSKSMDTAKWSVFALMFDDKYLDYIDALAADAAALYKDDHDFIGYYTDNELQFRAASSSTPGIYLKQWLAYDTSAASVPPAIAKAKAYAQKWMSENYNVESVASNVTTEMDNAFLLHICDYYYRTATEALRRHDPNHLLLGSRLHGKPKTLQQVHEACAKYNDIVSVNLYGVWEPDDAYFNTNFKKWVEKTPKPCFVTEFYTRAENTFFEGEQYSNSGEGGGWIVPDEAVRGRHYQNFTRRLISFDHCIGWQWFQFTDDWREDSGWNGKGLISPGYVPYYELLCSMRELHRNIYQIMDYYHSPQGAREPSVPDAPLASWE